jgi:hypothetical protein
MSAIPPKTDIRTDEKDVCFVPFPDLAAAALSLRIASTNLPATAQQRSPGYELAQ